MRVYASALSFSILLATGCSHTGSLPQVNNAFSFAGLRPNATASVIYKFPGGNGPGAPQGPLQPYNGGAIGTASDSKGGIVYAVVPQNGSWAFETVATLSNAADGTFPASGVIVDKSTGNLFGTSLSGGTSQSCGTIFELVKGAGRFSFKLLHAMTCADGSGPNELTEDPKTKTLYGTASSGGSGNGAGCVNGCGVLFKLVPNGKSYTYSVLYNFKGGSDAVQPGGTLVFDPASGNLYGTSIYGGNFDSVYCSQGCGTLFRVTPAGAETVLKRFAVDADGTVPFGGLSADPNAAKVTVLYGTTGGGGDLLNCARGAGGCGVVYSFTPSGNSGTEKVLHDFEGYSNKDGAQPMGPPAVVGTTLYGTTWQDGSNASSASANGGMIWKVSTNGSGYALLRTFSGAPNTTDAHLPYGWLAVGSNVLFGSSLEGGGKQCNGNGCGTVFELKP